MWERNDTDMIIVSFRYSRQAVKSDDEQRDHPEGDDQLDYDSKLFGAIER